MTASAIRGIDTSAPCPRELDGGPVGDMALVPQPVLARPDRASLHVIAAPVNVTSTEISRKIEVITRGEQ
jgi:hypothetical protein